MPLLSKLDRMLVMAVYYPGFEKKGTEQANEWGNFNTNMLVWKDRTPLAGLYDDTQQENMDRQMADMDEAGIDCAVFNWYYDADNKRSPGDKPITNFMRSQSDAKVKFCIGLEMSTTEVPVRSVDDWRAIIKRLDEAFKNPRYQRIGDDQRPVLFDIKLDITASRITAATGLTHKQLIDEIRTITGENVYMVACGPFISHWINQALVNGYDCYSAYNLFSTFTNRDTATAGPTATDYPSLDAVYKTEREYAAGKPSVIRPGTWQNGALKLDFIIPGTAGWDKRPWGGQNIGMPDDAQWEAHLQALYDFWLQAKRLGSQFQIIGVCLYAWNEWLEGGYIEPSLIKGRQRSLTMRRVLKKLPVESSFQTAPALFAHEIDPTQISRPVLSLDGWVMPSKK